MVSQQERPLLGDTAVQSCVSAESSARSRFSCCINGISGLLRIFTFLTMCFSFSPGTWVIRQALRLLMMRVALELSPIAEVSKARWGDPAHDFSAKQGGPAMLGRGEGKSLNATVSPFCPVFDLGLSGHTGTAALLLSSPAVLLLPGLCGHCDVEEHLSWTVCWWVSTCVFPCLVADPSLLCTEIYLPNTRWQEQGWDVAHDKPYRVSFDTGEQGLHKGKGGESKHRMIIEIPRCGSTSLFFFYPGKNVGALWDHRINGGHPY